MARNVYIKVPTGSRMAYVLFFIRRGRRVESSHAVIFLGQCRPCVQDPATGDSRRTAIGRDGRKRLGGVFHLLEQLVAGSLSRPAWPCRGRNRQPVLEDRCPQLGQRTRIYRDLVHAFLLAGEASACSISALRRSRPRSSSSSLVADLADDEAEAHAALGDLAVACLAASSVVA